MSRQKTYKVRLHIISPVHIGCDDVYEPTGFMVDKANKKLVAFDEMEFISSLTPAERTKFLALCEKGTLESILEIYKFMWGLRHTPRGHAVNVSEGFIAKYESKTKHHASKAKQELNNFQISRTSYLYSDNMPYIPGSAIKGSFRTGWLNYLNKGKKQTDKKFEEILLGGTFASDPFRMLKISDMVPVGTPDIKICFAVNKKKKLSKMEPRGPEQILEVILPGDTVFEGLITIHSQEKGNGITTPLKTDMSLFSETTAFFDREMSYEENILNGINLPAGIKTRLQKQFGERYQKNVFPIRLGRHSGAECLTLEGSRNIRIKGKNNEYTNGPHSTTVWLAGDAPKASSGLAPFGWAALEIMEADASNLWSERVVSDRPLSAPVTAVALQPPKPSITTESVTWQGAILTWSPGNATLTAQFEGKKAELKLSGDRSIVPQQFHKKLFDKKDAVKADVTLEKNGNALTIKAIA